MKRSAFALCALVFSASTSFAAVSVILKTGNAFTGESMAVKAGKVEIAGGDGAGQSIPVAAVDRIDMSEPAHLASARQLYADGDVINALVSVGRMRGEFEPLKNVTGARDWWLKAEFFRAALLIGQRRLKDVDAAMKEILALPDLAPEEKDHAAVFLAHMDGLNGDPRKASDELLKLILANTEPEVLADAWVFYGQNLLALNDQQGALLAFLRLPVLYPTETLQLGAARLGAARCYVAIEDKYHARQILEDLIKFHGKTIDAEEGKKLLRQVKRDLRIDDPNSEETKEPKK